MKTFKEFLTEEQQFHSVKDLVFGGSLSWTSGESIYIPLSLPMWKRITNIKKMYGVHATSIDGVEKLLKKQRTAAQVSTADSASEGGINHLATGVATEGGAVALLKGDAAFEADDDIYSYKDKQGRRWVEASYFEKSIPGLRNHVEKLKNRIYHTLEPDLADLWTGGKRKKLVAGTFPDLARYGETAGKAIKMYFDEIETYIKRKVTLFKNAYKYNQAEWRQRGDVSGGIDPAFGMGKATYWNELILGRYQAEIVIINKRMLGVNYTFEDDIFNRLSSKSAAASELAKTILKDRPSAKEFLDKLRRRVRTVQLVSDDDFKSRIKELLSTAKSMNKI